MDSGRGTKIGLRLVISRPGQLLVRAFSEPEVHGSAVDLRLSLLTHIEHRPITMEFDETWKNCPTVRGTILGVPRPSEAGGGYSRPKRGCFRYRRPGRAHVYAIVYPARLAQRMPVASDFDVF